MHSTAVHDANRNGECMRLALGADRYQTEDGERRQWGELYETSLSLGSLGSLGQLWALDARGAKPYVDTICAFDCGRIIGYGPVEKSI